MISLTSPGTELARFRRGTLPKIAIGVLLFIPLIYGALYLWAFWAPTDALDQLPVALVNEDTGAIQSDGGAVTAGDDIVDKLVDGNDLGWVVTDASDAAAGIADGTYYFSVTIPSEFSTDVVSVDGDEPTQAELQVDYNDSNSFLASTLGKSAMTQVRDAVAESISATTADTILVGVNTLADGVRDASDGASLIADGALQVDDGTSQLVVGLTDLATGSSTLSSGASTLAAGATSLSTGATSLSAGIDTAAAGASALSTQGTSVVADGAAQIASGAAELSTGVTSLQSSVATLPSSATQLNAGATSLATATATIASLAASNPTLTLAQLDGLLQQKGSSLAALSTGAASLASGTGQLAQVAPALVSGVDQLATGSASLATGSATLAAGAATVDDNTATLAAGLATADAGAATLADGAAQLSTGAASLASGAALLADGSQSAATGGQTLASGTATLASGSTELSDALSTGASDAPDYSESEITSMSDVLAEPVVLDSETTNLASTFGDGFAPFFIALATFVGALITWLILRALPTRVVASNASGLRAALTGFIPAAAIGVGQVAVMMVVLVYGVGLRPVHWVAASLFVYLTTLAFLALQQMFIILFGTAAGRVVSLVLLMLQLSSSGGTYPVETTPVFFQILHPYMPASYVVTGLRQLITGGVDARFWTALAYMIGLLIVSLVISSIAAGKQKVWTLGRLRPELSI